jgi:NADH-quinone oxidoreductase E subunit
MIAIQEIDHYEEIRKIVEKLGSKRENLIPILHETQKRFGYVNKDAQQIIADLLGIHPVEVYSVLSFYHFFHRIPKGKYIVRICKSISCDMHGKEKIKHALEKELGIKAGETTADGHFTFEEINCFGLCDKSPAMTINEQVFTELTPEKAVEIVKQFKEGNYEN